MVTYSENNDNTTEEIEEQAHKFDNISQSEENAEASRTEVTDMISTEENAEASNEQSTRENTETPNEQNTEEHVNDDKRYNLRKRKQVNYDNIKRHSASSRYQKGTRRLTRTSPHGDKS